jgi:hypothetical protein
VNRRRGAAWSLIAGVLIASAAPAPVMAQGPVRASDQQVKAAMLYNFAKFVEWPAAALGAPGTPLVFGVAGPPSFARMVEATLRDRALQGRSITVRNVASVAEMRSCHVVLFEEGEESRWISAIDGLRKSPVLTVGSAPDFARRGGMIGFVPVDSRISFEINNVSARQAGLTISSKLLRLASWTGGHE